MHKKLLATFIFLSFITQTISEPGGHPIFSRIVPSDLFGFLAILSGIIILIKGYRFSKKISNIYFWSFLLITCFFAPILFSLNIFASLVECLILLFLVIISILIFYSFKNNFIDELVPILCYTIIAASVLGLYDLSSSSIGLPRIFPSRTEGEALSGFRNAGQAGAYFLLFITILFPLRFSNLYYLLSSRNKKLLSIALIFAIIFLALTGKIAAYIGLVIGIILYAIMLRKLKVIFGIAIISFIGIVIFLNIEVLAPALYNRLTYKYESRVVENVKGTSENDFLQKNLGGAIESFEMRPLIGTGIGAFYGSIGEYEVHSTYFKMLGETGLLGLLGYILFICSFMQLFKLKKVRNFNPYGDYLYIMHPFIIGCLVSWAYTYHLRKREFWILLSVLVVVNYLAQIYNKKILESKG